jgi:hypothetical protein
MLHVESVERLNQTARLDISTADSLAGIQAQMCNGDENGQSQPLRSR